MLTQVDWWELLPAADEELLHLPYSHLLLPLLKGEHHTEIVSQLLVGPERQQPQLADKVGCYDR